MLRTPQFGNRVGQSIPGSEAVITTCLREVMLAGVQHHKRPDALTCQPRLRAGCVMVDKGLLSVWSIFESNLQLRLFAMGSKYSIEEPPISAAALFPDSSGSVDNVQPSRREATSRQVSLDDLSRKARRQLDVSKLASPACATETTLANQTWELTTSDRIVRLPELLAILQISRTTAYAWQKAGLLPRSVALGPRARGWKLSEIERFIAALGKEAQ
ncbi:AlpA family phage regulatory protein [Burkholderia sp. Bp9126]|nr:AlpA family phage regulatory protein [Burkholderia sp. Bp9126]